MTRISIGYLFSEDKKFVALINQQFIDPAGIYLNGLGGHIEPFESPLQAIRREFKEEGGIDIDSWKQMATLYRNGNSGVDTDSYGLQIDFFKAFSNTVFDVKTMEEETVSVYPIEQLRYLQCHPNLLTMLSLCLDDKLQVATFIY